MVGTKEESAYTRRCRVARPSGAYVSHRSLVSFAYAMALFNSFTWRVQSEELGTWAALLMAQHRSGRLCASYDNPARADTNRS